MSIKETIQALLERCDRQRNIPDLHSFKAEARCGVVFIVVGLYKDVDIYYIQCNDDGTETHHRMTAALPAVADLLEELGVDLTTVET